MLRRQIIDGCANLTVAKRFAIPPIPFRQVMPQPKASPKVEPRTEMRYGYV